MRKSYLPLLAGLVLVAAACSSAESEQIEGTWFEPANGVYVEIGGDGQFIVADNEALSDPFEWGDYTFDGETFTMNTASDAAYCPDTSLTSTVVFSDDGDQADFTFVEDSCAGSPRSTDLVWIRQSS